MLQHAVIISSLWSETFLMILLSGTNADHHLSFSSLFLLDLWELSLLVLSFLVVTTSLL